MKKIELLAPAGDLEKLKTAIIYGADAVYIGGEKFGLRAASKNFSDEEMREGIEFAHSRGKRVYVTCNIIPHNMDFNGVEEYFKSLEELGVDAIIIADPSFLSIAKSVVPNMELHLSTQANTTNYMTAQFWHNQGIQRIVSARELSMKEIKQIKEKCPTLEIEMFVHGAMCISYSGRCLMSNFMTNRDANKGACSQPCRWNYSLVEEKRPGEYFPVEQDERGTYFFNSKDLCLIEHIDEIISSGVDSMKIEGRMKTAYYVAVVVRAYRMAIDEYYKEPQKWAFKQEWLDEVKKASYRDFTTAFYDGKNDTSTSQNYGSSSYIRTYDIIGNVISYDKETKICRVRQKNRFFVNDEIEIIGPSFPTVKSTIKSIKSLSGESMDCSNIPMQEVFVDIGDVEVGEHFILRKQVEVKES